MDGLVTVEVWHILKKNFIIYLNSTIYILQKQKYLNYYALSLLYRILTKYSVSYQQ